MAKRTRILPAVASGQRNKRKLKDRPKYKRDGASFVAADGTFKRLTHVMLTGKSETVDKKRYLETREADVWVLDADAAVAEQRSDLPFRKDEEVDGKKTWVDVSVFGGTFVAYEGETPVFATLISPGRGGTPFPGRDPISTASTPVGTFRVDGSRHTIHRRGWTSCHRSRWPDSSPSRYIASRH